MGLPGLFHEVWTMSEQSKRIHIVSSVEEAQEIIDNYEAQVGRLQECVAYAYHLLDAEIGKHSADAILQFLQEGDWQ